MKDSLLLGAPAAPGRALAGHELIRTSDPCTNLIPGVHKPVVVCVTSELDLLGRSDDGQVDACAERHGQRSWSEYALGRSFLHRSVLLPRNRPGSAGCACHETRSRSWALSRYNRHGAKPGCSFVWKAELTKRRYA